MHYKILLMYTTHSSWLYSFSNFSASCIVPIWNWIWFIYKNTVSHWNVRKKVTTIEFFQHSLKRQNKVNLQQKRKIKLVIYGRQTQYKQLIRIVKGTLFMVVEKSTFCSGSLIWNNNSIHTTHYLDVFFLLWVCLPATWPWILHTVQASPLYLRRPDQSTYINIKTSFDSSASIVRSRKMQL